MSGDGDSLLFGRTGVEMEAMTAASVALLTIYDMAKALDREMVISGVRRCPKPAASPATGLLRTESGTKPDACSGGTLQNGASA